MNQPSFNNSETVRYAKEIHGKITYGVKKAAAKYLARELGTHVQGAESRFLLWHPKIKECKKINLELFVPLQHFTFDKPEQHVNMSFYSFPTDRVDEFACSVIDHLPAGNREQFGAFYQYRIFHKDDSSEIIRDPMAWSLPYGIYAPAELYDVEKVRSERKDADYFLKVEKDESLRIKPSVNLLEIHPGTATKGGTLQSLSNRFKQIATTLKSGGELAPDEKNLMGFDAIELMPVDPVIEHPENHQFWSPVYQPKNDGDEVAIHLKKPSVINWGYDIVLFGSAAVNASILSTGRPHELLELIETLHNFPGRPIKVVLDVVYGHADNQGMNVLPKEFFAGNNMYGLNIHFKHPLVREMILEMQRRKIDWGFDGVRVDGAQDFKFYDESSDLMIHDDDFLNRMSEVPQRVAGVDYKPWMIFEDGRPWPRDDWELASTYREITEKQGHPHQWASMIFAYNTPYNYTYWVSKWWRIKELLTFGDKWISGYANHDTMRRGTQTNPHSINVNFQLGNSLKMVMDNAYNNPATTLIMNGFLPGVPMDFVQALGKTPWSFIRNTDTEYALKVAAEEAYFTDWQITDVEFRNSRYFKKLKDLGFHSLEGLRRFAKSLLHLVQATDYSPQNIASLLNQFDPPFEVKIWNLEKLNSYASAWTDDLHTYCNADMHADQVNAQKAAFNLSVRQYRLQNPWLSSNFSDSDQFLYREPVDGTVLFYGYRRDPVSGKQVVVIANMEGQAKQISIKDLGLPIKDYTGWKVALSTPTLKPKEINEPLKVAITQGILFEKIN
jgi:hypothetical protein